MKSFAERYLLKNHSYLLAFLLLALFRQGGWRYFQNHIPEILNSLWIVAVMIYILIPNLLYQGKYLRFILFYALSLYIGIFLMEVLIEGGALGDAFTWFAIEHEGADLLINSGIIFALKMAFDYGKRQNRLIQLEAEHTESELRFLKSQLNPHVLFNNLNNIYSFALHESKHTPEMILKLADIMRYMLYESHQDLVDLEQELAYVENYIELQKIQLEGRGEILVEIDGDVKGLKIAPMMLISFIENCFKHSAETKTDGLRIIIKIETQGDSIELYTENSFDEADPGTEKSLEVGGIGLKNVQRRLDLIYPDKHQLIIKELKQLYIVNLSIDLT